MDQQPYQPPTWQQPQQPNTSTVKRLQNWFQRLSGGGKAAVAAAAVLVVLFCTCGTCVTGIAALSNNGSSGSSTPTLGVARSNTATSGPTATPKPTATATPKPQPKVVLTISGTGDKSSKVFAVSGTWELHWSCMDNSGVDGLLGVFVYPQGENQVYYDSIDGTCTNGKTTKDLSTEQDGGSYYLKVISANVSYTITAVDIPG